MTAWAGLYDGKYGSPYVMQFPKNQPNRGVIAQLFLHRGMRKDAALVAALLGAVAGGSASSSYTRKKDINAGPTSMTQHGGTQIIETVYDINRVTTSADTTELNTYMFAKNHNLTLKLDSGGNSIKGNPGKF